MVISNNTYPLNVLSTFGISVKSETGKASLPEALGNYLDTIIKAGDLESLFEAAPQVINAAEKIAKQDARVALNALLAMTQSTEMLDKQIGNLNRLGKDGAKKTDYILLTILHSQKNLYSKIAQQVGLIDKGLFLSIEDRTKFNIFLENLAEQNIELGKKEKNYLSELLKDDLFVVTGELRKTPLNPERLLQTASTIKLYENKLGIKKISTTTTQDEIGLKLIHESLTTITDDLQANKQRNVIETLLTTLDSID